MAFNKVDVKDRVVQYPRDYQVIDSPDQIGMKRLIPAPGVISEVGTAANKAYEQPTQDYMYDTWGDKPIVTIELDTTTPIISTTEPVISSPCDIVIEGAIANVNGKLEFERGVLVETQNNATTPTSTSQVLIENAGAKLPNDVADITTISGGKGVQIVNTNVGRDGVLYALDSSEEILAYNTALINVDLVQIKPLPDFSFDKYTVVEGHTRLDDFTQRDDISKIGMYYDVVGTTARSIDFIVAKGTYLNTTDAKNNFPSKNLIYQLATPFTRTIDLPEPLLTYADYILAGVNDGNIPLEKANLVLSSTTYHLNNTTLSDSELTYKAQTIDDVLHEGRNIKSLGVITEDSSAYGIQRWSITSEDATENNIDINNITVNYTTSETAGLPNATITAKNSVAQAHDALALSVNAVGEQVVDTVKILNDTVGNLGAKGVKNFDVTVAGVATWTNPTSADFEDITLYQAKYDITHVDRIQLDNDDNVTKYTTTGESQTVPVDAETAYYYVIIPRYSLGGNDYYGDRRSVQITSPAFLDYYNAPDNFGDFEHYSADIGTVSLETYGIVLAQRTSGTTQISRGVTRTSTSVDLSSYNNLETLAINDDVISGTLTVSISSDASGSTVLASTTVDITTLPTAINLDVSAISSGYIFVECVDTALNATCELYVTRVRGEV